MDYHFLSREQFETKIENGELLEYAQVHGKDYYGTLKEPVIENLKQGIDVLMDLDIQGAEQLRTVDDEFVRRSVIDLFILPRTLEELGERIRGRGAMDPREFETRMRNAEEEMRHWPKYEYTLISGSKEEDFAEFGAILAAERHRSCRLIPDEETGD